MGKSIVFSADCVEQYNAFNVHKFSYYLHIFGEYWSNAPLPWLLPLPMSFVVVVVVVVAAATQLFSVFDHACQAIESFRSNTKKFEVFLAAITEILDTNSDQFPNKSIFMIATTTHQFLDRNFFCHATHYYKYEARSNGQSKTEFDCRTKS